MKLKLKLNKKLLQKIMKRIEDNPKSWNQKNWHCGTSHCFAGHVTLEIIRKEFKYDPKKDDENNTKLNQLECDIWNDLGRPVTENLMLCDTTAIIAAYHLGLNEKQAMTLFVPSNTKKKLREKVDKILRGEL